MVSDSRHRHSALRSTRGVAEVLSYVLLLGLVSIGIAVVVVAGGTVIDDSKQSIKVGQAEHALTQLDSQASRIALGESPTQQVDLGFTGSGGSLRTHPDSGWIRVRLIHSSNGTTEKVVNTSLGAVAYEHGETTIAYQGGGVWRQDGGSSVMLSRPEFHYRNKTLNLPIITTRGERSLYSEVGVTQSGSPVRKFPNAMTGWENKLVTQTVTITVQSEYYEAWGRFFETTTNAIIGYDHADETVTIKFLSVANRFRLQSGIIATSGPGKIELAGNGAYVNSYNSSMGEYDATHHTNGRVEAAGDVNITGDATIDGDVLSGGFVGVSSSAGEINGDAHHTDGYQNDGTITGNISSINGITSVPPIDSLVTWKTDTLRTTNDNNQTEVIDGARIDMDGSSGELGPGRYYLERMDLTGKTLVVNTTAGDVTIGVQEWVKVAKSGGTNGNLTIKGNGTVHLFVAGDDETTVSITGLGNRDTHFHVGKDSAVHIPGERARHLRVYGKRDHITTIAGSNGKESSFDGVIYAPAGEFGTGYTYVKQADVYGAVVTGNLTLGQYGAVHFDYALHDEIFPLAPTVSRLDFLYVTRHNVTVSPQ